MVQNSKVGETPGSYECGPKGDTKPDGFAANWLSIHMKANAPLCFRSSEAINSPTMNRVSVWNPYGFFSPVLVFVPFPPKNRSTWPTKPLKFVMVDGSRPSAWVPVGSVAAAKPSIRPGN